MARDEELDEEFPLGDGTAETAADVTCPHCGEATVISVDPGGGSIQQYVEDCEVCCRPWQLTVRFVEGIAIVDAKGLEE